MAKAYKGRLESLVIRIKNRIPWAILEGQALLIKLRISHKGSTVNIEEGLNHVETIDPTS